MATDGLVGILTSRPVRLVLYVALLVYGFTVFRGIAVKDKQWDLRTYYYAALVHSLGGDPYDTESLSQAAGQKIEFPYVYPPVTLYLFRPLLLLDYRTCYAVFLVLKLAALALLVRLWVKFLKPDRSYGLLLLLFCFFAFRKALIRDLNAGNISCFEQVLVWAAAFCFLRGRPLSFSLLIAGSALFKFTSIALLAIPLAERGRKWLVSTISVASGFLLVNAASYVAGPRLYRGFISNALALDERGKVNPSSLALIRDGLSRIADPVSASLPNLDHAVYALLLAGLALAAYAAVRWIEPARRRSDFMIFCFFVYALAAPRFKDYSYMLLIVPSLYVIRHAIKSLIGKALASLLVCFYLFTYQPLVAAAVLLVVFLRHFMTAARGGPQSKVGLEPDSRC